MDDLKNVAVSLHSSDEETRRLAVVSLAGRPFAEVQDLIFTAMGDESWRVRKEAVDTILTFCCSSEIVEILVKMLRSHDNAGLRNSAVETLERLGKSAMSTLCRYIDDEDHDLRKFVIDILGQVGDRSAVPLLIKSLSDSDRNVSAAAAENLGKLRDPVAVPHLLAVLPTATPWMRYTILEALSSIGQPVPLSIIAPLAGDRLLKKAVFDCLGVIGEAEAVPLLVDGLRERPKSTREAAAAALLKVRGRLSPGAEKEFVTCLRSLSGTPAIEGLLSLLETGDRTIKEAVVTLLGTIGDIRAIPQLLHGCRDDRLRQQCLVAFSGMGEAGIQALLNAFDSAGDDERCLIAYICGELGCKTCTPQLKKGMRDPYYLLRKVSMVAAGKIGRTDLVNDIVLLLDDVEPEVRDAAIDGLCHLARQDSAAVLTIAGQLAVAGSAEKRRDSVLLFTALREGEKLSLLVKDEDPVVRKAAVTALAELRWKNSVGCLVMALADEDVEVRIAAAGALGEIDGSAGLAPLLLALKDDDQWVRCSAVKSLGKLGTEEALRAITEVLGTADGIVKVAAVEALSEAGSQRALLLVEEALGDRDDDVVKAAIAGLEKGGSAWIETHLEMLINHPQWDVRSSFVRAMAATLGTASIPHLTRALGSEKDELVRSVITELLDRLQ